MWRAVPKIYSKSEGTKNKSIPRYPLSFASGSPSSDAMDDRPKPMNSMRALVEKEAAENRKLRDAGLPVVVGTVSFEEAGDRVADRPMNAMRALLKKEAAEDRKLRDAGLPVVVATFEETELEAQETWRKMGLTMDTLEETFSAFCDVEPKATAEVIMTMRSLKEALAAGEAVPDDVDPALLAKLGGLWLTDEEEAGESAKDARKREKRERKFALAVAKRVATMRRAASEPGAG